jgi:hypothetical protein
MISVKPVISMPAFFIELTWWASIGFLLEGFVPHMQQYFVNLYDVLRVTRIVKKSLFGF